MTGEEAIEIIKREFNLAAINNLTQKYLMQDLTIRSITAQLSKIGSDISDLMRFKEEILLGIYPIGCIYQTTDNLNPKANFGGDWELFEQDESCYKWKRIA